MKGLLFTAVVAIFVAASGDSRAQTCTPKFAQQIKILDETSAHYCTTEECRLEAVGLKCETRELCERVLKHNSHPTPASYNDLRKDVAVLDGKILDWAVRNKIVTMPGATVGLAPQ